MHYSQYLKQQQKRRHRVHLAALPPSNAYSRATRPNTSNGNMMTMTDMCSPHVVSLWYELHCFNAWTTSYRVFSGRPWNFLAHFPFNAGIQWQGDVIHTLVRPVTRISYQVVLEHTFSVRRSDSNLKSRLTLIGCDFQLCERTRQWRTQCARSGCVGCKYVQIRTFRVFLSTALNNARFVAITICLHLQDCDIHGLHIRWGWRMNNTM